MFVINQVEYQIELMHSPYTYILIMWSLFAANK